MPQCLPTPVQSSTDFCKRNLWTDNRTVHDYDDGQTYCYLWHEERLEEQLTKLVLNAINPNLRMYQCTQTHEVGKIKTAILL
ncbi:hypothetical protein PR048_029359 [Dryococelus australis]|uniref:Uncharacterized protein n=1 Tax=Dryococelus australis TaxID=614101 RepID=A0ABQ9GD64_9NEOP|nr:hypothetical protein PR048_029359 [Dryococelus australis]